MKSIISFKNHQNETLRGILHEPYGGDRIVKKHIVIFPNGGLMGCEGDFRAYVRITKVLISNGFHVMRFSPSGIGLSDGYIKDCNQIDLFGNVETGLFVNDLKSAVDYIVKKYPSFEITLAGICGGAISSFLTASELDIVKNIIAISTPITLDNSLINYKKRMSGEQAKFLFSTYISKFFSPKAWLRLLSFKSNIPEIKEIILNLLGKQMNEKDKIEFLNTLNKEFFQSAMRLIKKRTKILFIYGDSDRAMWEFEKYFIEEKFKNKLRRPFDYFIIKNGNHMLTWVEMQVEASRIMVEWLNKCSEIDQI